MKKIILGSLAISVFSFGGCTEIKTNANYANSNKALVVNSNTANNLDKLPANVMNSNTMNSNTSNSNMKNSNKEVSSNDDQFMNESAQGGMMEVKLGELASTKAQSAEVKSFGKKMVGDHTKANNELKALAAKKKIELPKEMSSAQKENYDRLSKLSGAEFDKEYVELMVDDHEADVDAFQEQAEDAEDADIKAFAAKYTPILKSHYEMIGAISDKMK